MTSRQPSATPPLPPAPRPAPWVRTRLRAAPLGTVLGALLAFVAVLLATALPRVQDRSADQALRSFLHHSLPSSTSLLAAAPAPKSGEKSQALDATLTSLLAHTGAAFHVDPDTVVHGTRTTQRQTLTNPELSRPSGLPPRMSVLYVRQAEAHVKLVQGHWPSATPTGATAPAPAQGAPGAVPPPLQVALSERAAQTLGARLGSVLQSKPLFGDTASVEVVGLFTVPDETEDFWVGLYCLARACEHYTGENLSWDVDAFTGAGDLNRLDSWGHTAEDFWRLPVDVDRLRADELDATTKGVAAYIDGPTAAALVRETGREWLRTTSSLPTLLKDAQARRQAAAPLAAIGPAGVGGVAFVVLCLAGALAADRRKSELRLLLARGGSRTTIVGRLLGESAVTVLPAAAAATALAVLLLPTPRLAPSVFSAATVALLALLAFPVRAAVLLSPRRPAGRWRRPVAELLVLLTTAAAVLEVGRRGIAPAGSDPDPLLIAAPLLIALCGGLLLARIQPVVTGWLTAAARRRSGLVGFLGLARAARGSGARDAGSRAGGRTGPSVLPMVALILAVTTGGFGAAVLDSVDSARLGVARLTVGGDASITAYGDLPLPDGLAKAAGELPGIRTSVPLRVDDTAVLDTAQGAASVTVVTVDPAAYAQLSRALGCGAFDPALLAGDGARSPGAPVPALFSAGLARRTGPGTYALRPGNGEELQTRVAGVLDCIPAMPAPDVPVVVLPVGLAATRIDGADRPNRWYGLGSADRDQLRALVPTDPAGDRYLIRTSAETVAELGADPLQRSAQRLFWASVAAAAGFALLATLLTMMRAVPERAALLARLRTMGLRRRQGVALILSEALPQTLAAALGGAMAATAAVALLGPAIDLSTLVGARVPTGIRLTAWPVLTQALGLAALVAGAVLVEAATSGRRQITTELRAGDQS